MTDQPDIVDDLTEWAHLCFTKGDTDSFLTLATAISEIKSLRDDLNASK
jgi:hypothetical protein